MGPGTVLGILYFTVLCSSQSVQNLQTLIEQGQIRLVDPQSSQNVIVLNSKPTAAPPGSEASAPVLALPDGTVVRVNQPGVQPPKNSPRLWEKPAPQPIVNSFQLDANTLLTPGRGQTSVQLGPKEVHHKVAAHATKPAINGVPTAVGNQAILAPHSTHQRPNSNVQPLNLGGISGARLITAESQGQQQLFLLIPGADGQQQAVPVSILGNAGIQAPTTASPTLVTSPDPSVFSIQLAPQQSRPIVQTSQFNLQELLTPFNRPAEESRAPNAAQTSNQFPTIAIERPTTKPVEKTESTTVHSAGKLLDSSREQSMTSSPVTSDESSEAESGEATIKPTEATKKPKHKKHRKHANVEVEAKKSDDVAKDGEAHVSTTVEQTSTTMESTTTTTEKPTKKHRKHRTTTPKPEETSSEESEEAEEPSSSTSTSTTTMTTTVATTPSTTTHEETEKPTKKSKKHKTTTTAPVESSSEESEEVITESTTEKTTTSTTTTTTTTTTARPTTEATSQHTKKIRKIKKHRTTTAQQSSNEDEVEITAVDTTVVSTTAKTEEPTNETSTTEAPVKETEATSAPSTVSMKKAKATKTTTPKKTVSVVKDSENAVDSSVTTEKPTKSTKATTSTSVDPVTSSKKGEEVALNRSEGSTNVIGREPHFGGLLETTKKATTKKDSAVTTHAPNTSVVLDNEDDDSEKRANEEDDRQLEVVDDIVNAEIQQIELLPSSTMKEKSVIPAPHSKSTVAVTEKKLSKDVPKELIMSDFLIATKEPQNITSTTSESDDSTTTLSTQETFTPPTAHHKKKNVKAASSEEKSSEESGSNEDEDKSEERAVKKTVVVDEIKDKDFPTTTSLPDGVHVIDGGGDSGSNEDEAAEFLKKTTASEKIESHDENMTTSTVSSITVADKKEEFTEKTDANEGLTTSAPELFTKAPSHKVSAKLTEGKSKVVDSDQFVGSEEQLVLDRQVKALLKSINQKKEILKQRKKKKLQPAFEGAPTAIVSSKAPRVEAKVEDLERLLAQNPLPEGTTLNISPETTTAQPTRKEEVNGNEIESATTTASRAKKELSLERQPERDPFDPPKANSAKLLKTDPSRIRLPTDRNGMIKAPPLAPITIDLGEEELELIKVLERNPLDVVVKRTTKAHRGQPEIEITTENPLSNRHSIVQEKASKELRVREINSKPNDPNMIVLNEALAFNRKTGKFLKAKHWGRFTEPPPMKIRQLKRSTKQPRSSNPKTRAVASTATVEVKASAQQKEVPNQKMEDEFVKSSQVKENPNKVMKKFTITRRPEGAQSTTQPPTVTQRPAQPPPLHRITIQQIPLPQAPVNQFQARTFPTIPPVLRNQFIPNFPFQQQQPQLPVNQLNQQFLLRQNPRTIQPFLPRQPLPPPPPPQLTVEQQMTLRNQQQVQQQRQQFVRQQQQPQQQFLNRPSMTMSSISPFIPTPAPTTRITATPINVTQRQKNFETALVRSGEKSSEADLEEPIHEAASKLNRPVATAPTKIPTKIAPRRTTVAAGKALLATTTFAPAKKIPSAHPRRTTTRAPVSGKQKTAPTTVAPKENPSEDGVASPSANTLNRMARQQKEQQQSRLKKQSLEDEPGISKSQGKHRSVASTDRPRQMGAQSANMVDIMIEELDANIAALPHDGEIENVENANLDGPVKSIPITDPLAAIFIDHDPDRGTIDRDARN